MAASTVTFLVWRRLKSSSSSLSAAIACRRNMSKLTYTGGHLPSSQGPIKTRETDRTEEGGSQSVPPFKMVLPNYETENFTFDEQEGILTDPEDEKRFYEEVVEPWNKHTFKDMAKELDSMETRQFEVTKEGWEFVERLLPKKLIPKIPDAKAGDELPSGFRVPSAKPGDYEYHVGRTRNHMLPVYTKLNRDSMLLTTVVRKCDGNLYKLRDDICAFLRDRYRLEFHSQIDELNETIRFRGDFEQDFKEFLLAKGF